MDWSGVQARNPRHVLGHVLFEKGVDGRRPVRIVVADIVSRLTVVDDVVLEN